MASRPLSVLLRQLRPGAAPSSLLQSLQAAASPAARRLQPFSRTPIRLAHQIPKPPAPSSSTPPSSPSSSSSKGSSDSTAKDRNVVSAANLGRLQSQPHYRLTFTCIPCGSRSDHHVSKQGYHRGSVLITCPGCHNRHVISDHLRIFGDRKITVEDLMREKGRLVKKGTLGVDQDVEFWPDERDDGVEETGAPPPAGSEGANPKF